MKLQASAKYWQYKQTGKLAGICNGMGAANSLLSFFIPNTMYGLDVEETGDIHDFDYNEGETEADKEAADIRFLTNLMRRINAASRWLAPLRRRRALKYYEAVHYKGLAAFLKKGNSN